MRRQQSTPPPLDRMIWRYVIIVAALAVLVTLLVACSSSPASRRATPAVTSAVTASTPPSESPTTRIPVGKDESLWPLPNIKLTPGSVTPGCTYPRPASQRVVTAATKRLVAQEYHYVGLPGIANVEYDHLIPFSLCGGNDSRNIWPEPADGITQSSFTHNRKDQLENYAANRVATHHMTLTFAQGLFVPDWRSSWCQYREHYASAGVVCP